MIREAVPADAAALAGVQHRAWWRAYGEYVDSERFGTLEERIVRWHELLRRPERTLVFDLHGTVAAFASIGPARDRDLGPDVGELMALYVDPPAQGAGVGGLLLAAVRDRLREDALAEAVLWVFAANEHARHVYERHGWTLEPAGVRADGWAPELRYRLAL